MSLLIESYNNFFVVPWFANGEGFDLIIDRFISVLFLLMYCKFSTMEVHMNLI